MGQIQTDRQMLLQHEEIRASPFVAEFLEANEALIQAIASYFDTVEQPWKEEGLLKNHDGSEVRDLDVTIEEGSYIQINDERTKGEGIPYEAGIALFQDSNTDPVIDITVYRGKEGSLEFGSPQRTSIETATSTFRLGVNPDETAAATRYMQHFCSVIEALKNRFLEGKA